MEPNSLNFKSNTITMKKLLLIAVIISNSFIAAYASGTLPGEKIKNVSVTSLGVADGNLKFNCTYLNPNGDKFHLELVDNQGNKLYKEIFTEKNFNKTFIASSELGTIVLVLTNIKDKTRHRFEISTAQRFVEELSITSTN
jgi:hypothetical protein